MFSVYKVDYTLHNGGVFTPVTAGVFSYKPNLKSIIESLIELKEYNDIIKNLNKRENMTVNISDNYIIIKEKVWDIINYHDYEEGYINKPIFSMNVEKIDVLELSD